MFILQFFWANNHISMGRDRTGEHAWIHGYSNDTFNNGTLEEEASNCTITN